ncbi:hypothetical protein [Rhodoligotrophos defluvii]|uniref:hypothetical protein n=1 Tax=Rhodoligotrophos defluvii TaxID=2561934 RepID=UPI0010CA0882|nr:hypothetical protein [Rhodoligotrophos defluvii]
MTARALSELNSGAFEPDMVSAMLAAYNKAVNALGTRSDEPTRLRIAHAIIGFATQGESDPGRLCEKALAIV